MLSRRPPSNPSVIILPLKWIIFLLLTYSFTRLGQSKQKFIIFFVVGYFTFCFTCRIETLSNSKSLLLRTKRNDFCVVFQKKVHHIKVFIKNDFWPKKHYCSKIEKKLCSFLKKDWTSKIKTKNLMIIMKEKKQKNTYHPYPLIALKNVLKKKRIEGSRCGSEIPFFPSFPSSFLHWAVKT